jgi:hypothetical protein
MLRKSLLNHFSQTNSSATSTVILGVIGMDDQDSSTSTSSITAPQLTVANRYFSAHVILQEIGQEPLNVYPPVTAADPQQDGQDSSSLPLPFKEDGVILVFDHHMDVESGSSSSSSSSPTDVHVSTPTAAAVASFNALEPVHDRAEALLLQAGELLRLCVGVSVHVSVCKQSPENNSHDGDSADSAILVEQRRTNTKEYEAEYARRILWCLDRGYKYVEEDLSAEGVARVTTCVTSRDLRGLWRLCVGPCGRRRSWVETNKRN